MGSLLHGAGVGGEASTDRVAGCGRRGEHADRGAGRRHGDHGAVLAGSVPVEGPGRAGRRASVGSSAEAGPPGDRGRDAEAAAEEARCHPLVHSAAGRAAEDRNTSVARAWRAYGVKPWKAESFRFSTDPELVGKVTDICGLYLAPPENAIVLCVDEKSQIQALDRTVPILPMQPGKIERRSHDYYRHGTTTLFAALDIATGQVTAALKPRHRHQEFLAFLKQIERTYRDALDADGHPVELHLVMDNYAAHKHQNVRAWLADHPRFIVHFTPTHASWMNLVEVWFGIVERQAVRRGVFKSVKDLNAKLRAYIDGWNERAHPFVWTKTADQILTKANRPTTSNPRH